MLQNTMLGNPGAVDKGIQALGVQPVGNGGGSNMPGNTTLNNPGTMPMNPIMQPAPTNPAINPGAVPGNLLNTAGTQSVDPTNAANQSHQLNDVFGKGIGGDINSAINNLGSNDSSYIQAFQKQMAQPNAENLSTLNTTLGNAGVGANSSTMAIADADFEAGVSSQEGSFISQLQQTDQQNLLGLLTGTEGAANKEASTSVWGDIGNVLQGIGQTAAAVAPAFI